MSDTSTLQFKVKFVDPDLDPEEQDEQATRLLSELKEMDEIDDIGRAVDPNPPEGNKSFGGFVAGMLQGEAEANAFSSVASFIGDRAASKNIEMELERNGRTLRIAATNKQDMEEILPLLQQFLAETEEAAPTLAEPRTILILAAQPTETQRARLDAEVRDIKEGLQRSRHRDQLLLETRWAVTARDMQRAMLEAKPNIVHFSGHSGADITPEIAALVEQGGLSHLLDGESLASFFELFVGQVNCVFLNGCHSADEAAEIAQHIDYVIGMNDDIQDQAAIEFAVGFYDALGAGESIEFAFKLGLNAIRLAGLTGHEIPVLQRKAALDVG